MAAAVKEPNPSERSSDLQSPGTILLAGGVIVVAALAAYHNSFHGPFVFDDLGDIAQNRSIRRLWSALSPPQDGMPVTGRPMANLSFAINFALDGTKVWGYHAVNLAIHILAGLTLFGILRRTLRLWRDDSVSLVLAFAAALIWTLHPLQTESVTYLSQRVESLMGLFYLLTVYCFIRYAENGAGWGWLSIGACLLGMATKEVMATAPVMVLLYDRTFVSGSFAQAWRLRRRFYLGLACTWLLLACLLAVTGNRGGTAGFDAAISPPAYAITQFRAVAHYLRLSVWPSPLVFFYGSTVGGSLAELAVDMVVVGVLLAGTVYLLFRPLRLKGRGEGGAYARLRPAERGYAGPDVASLCRGKHALGFAGAWFFLILAPSSSVVPVATETIAEHRMYLPLAAVIVVGVCGVFSLLEWARLRPALRNAGGWIILALVAVVCAGFTAQRNEDYRSDLVLWSATADKFPDNDITQYTLGTVLARTGRTTEAIEHYREALRLKPDYPAARNNLGRALADTGHWTEAVAQYEQALERDPELATLHFNLGDALSHLGRLDEAIASYKECVRLDPGRPDALYNLGTTLVRAGRAQEALPYYADALRLVPDSPEIHNNMGFALAQLGRFPEARSQFEEALRLKPDDPDALANLGRLPSAQPGP
jgi:protein O-mannosyl-transferase